MKFLSLAAILLLLVSAQAQKKSNTAIQQQLKSLGAGEIGVHYDEASKVTTIKAVSENFSGNEVNRVGVKAMNFGVGVIYPGAGLDRSPEHFMFSFWVMSGKPRFGYDRTFSVFLGSEALQLGEARYVARRDGMEYLNFNLTRDQTMKIASGSRVRFLLGRHEFVFTPSQLKLLADLCRATEVN